MQVLVVFRTRCGCVRSEMMDDCMLRDEWLVPLGGRPELVSFTQSSCSPEKLDIDIRRFELHKLGDGMFLYEEV